MGTLARSVRVLARGSARRSNSPERHPLFPAWSAVIGSLAVGAGLSLTVPVPLRVAAGAVALLTILVGLGMRGISVRRAEALAGGLLVVAAWTMSCLLLDGLPPLCLGLGALAGLGTLARLWEGAASRPWGLWLCRLSWAGLAGILVAAKQPLLGGIVVLTACADELLRLQPARRARAGALADVAWASAWFLVAFASTYWAT